MSKKSASLLRWLLLPTCALLLSCNLSASDTDGRSELAPCVQAIPLTEIIRTTFPDSVAGRAWGHSGGQTSTHFEGRRRWSHESAPTEEIQSAELAKFPEFCQTLHEALQVSCPNVSRPTVGHSATPVQASVAGSCTMYLSHEHEGAVFAAYWFPLQSGNARLLFVSHGW